MIRAAASGDAAAFLHEKFIAAGLAMRIIISIKKAPFYVKMFVQYSPVMLVKSGERDISRFAKDFFHVKT